MAHDQRIEIDPRTLVRTGAISPEKFKEVVASYPEGTDLISAMLRTQTIVEEDVFRAYAYESKIPYVEADDISPPKEVLEIVSHEFAREHVVVPLRISGGKLVIAVRSPSMKLRSALGQVVDYELDFAIASNHTLNSKINEYYSADSEAASIGMESEDEDFAPSLDSLLNSVDDGSDQTITKSVGLLITQGVSVGASDIHIEPFAKKVRVRYRVDGELRVSRLDYKSSVGLRVISRIKVMARLDTTEHRKPQDGRISFTHNRKRVDIRVAIIPVVSGEGGGSKVVMRILANDLAGKPLSELNFSDINYKFMQKAISKPHGMILVTGPTGSGKSTTLYSALTEVAKDNVNVMAVEDPVEYKVDGVNQVQVHPDAGVTFANSLRAFLRADPDVILVGEIRDGETAEIAIKAALTGHMVFSTLHTNSASLTISRLAEMGTAPYLIADALTAVLSQRLVKRLCQLCRVAYEPEISEIMALNGGEIPVNIPTIYAASETGCARCSKGYSGRVPVHELLPVNAKVKRAIMKGQSSEEIEQIAVETAGMKTLLRDGWEKVASGLTDIASISSLGAGEYDFFDEDEQVP